MKRHRFPSLGVAAAGLLLLAPYPASASSHREALSVLDSPCADNTDTYAWVSPGAHDKLYLVMSFSPLHEPGQGNQGLRACDGYRYEFHVGKGANIMDDETVYRIEFKKTVPTDPHGPPSASDGLGGGNELLWQISGGTETYKVTRRKNRNDIVLGNDLPVLPNNHGPQTDRLVYGLGPAFQGYNSGDRTSREVGEYDEAFVDTFVHNLSNGGRIIAGQFDDPYHLDEKGIFDLVNLCEAGLDPLTAAPGFPGARQTDCEDVFTGFNVFSIALELPVTDLFPNGIPHNGVLDANSTDSLLRVWASISRRERRRVDTTKVATGYTDEGPWRQVGRNALPLFNAGLVGTERQTLYLQTSPEKDVSRFGGDVLFPVLVRDASALGIYAALTPPLDPAAAGLLGPRFDIINAINLGRPIPIADGSTGDVITLDAAVDSAFPNGRRLGNLNGSNMGSDQVNAVLISLIVAGNPAAGASDGVFTNDKNYRTVFPFLAVAHQGLHEGHGGTNQLP